MDDRDIPPKPPDKPPADESFEYSPALTVTLPFNGEQNGSGPLSHSHPMELSDTNRKRSAVINSSPSTTQPPVKAMKTTPVEARLKYSTLDKGPYVVHVSQIENDVKSGTTLHQIKFGLFLLKNNITNVLPDGVKRIGRNRVAVVFKSPEDANAFVTNPILEKYKYQAVIPLFNITRMGVVRDVPIDMTDEQVCNEITVPYGCGKVIKVRRLNRKVINNDGEPEWKPRPTVVLTFDGQVLPKRVYMCYNSLEVEQYLYPTIQCFNCCRFGHTRTQCRSKPRCFKCAQDHPGDGCDVCDAYCINCYGDHLATSKDCPEYNRQRAIKVLMAEQAISYPEADKKLPKISRGINYANAVKVTAPRQSAQSEYSSPPRPRTIQPTHTHKKTVFLKPKARAPLSPGYDTHTHQALVRDYSFTPSQNGCGFTQVPSQDIENHNIGDPIEQLVTLLSTLLTSKNLPDHVADKLTMIFRILNGSPTEFSTMER